MKSALNKNKLLAGLLVVLAVVLVCGYYFYHKSQLNNPCSSSYQGVECCHGLCSGNQNDNSDIYYDKNGCAQSRSGGVHPNFCVKQ
jgi:hypothetical protein